MPDIVKATPSQRVTLARVKVGDQLMTALDEDEGTVVPWRFSTGTVREVMYRHERKAGPDEMPGRLIALQFTDGTSTAERYGTTSHYPAAIFAGGRP